MKILFLKIKDLTEKLYLIIYQLALVFTILFYVVLKAATGHKFVVTSEEKVYSIILFLSFVLSGYYKERKKHNTIFDISMRYLLLVFLIATLIFSIQFLYFTFTFDYGFNEELIFILLIFFLLPIIFTWCNLYFIKNLIKELKK